MALPKVRSACDDGVVSSWGVIVLGWQLAFWPPEVRAAGTCPSAAEVTALLGPLLPIADSAAATRDLVELVPLGEGMSLRLLDPRGQVINERVLSASSTCRARAGEAAVIIATWEADLHADVAFPSSTRREEPPGRAAPPPPIERAPLVVAPGVAVSGITGASPSATATAPQSVTIGAEVFVAAPSGAGTTPAGALEVTSGGGRWHGRAALLATGTHVVRLPPGSVSWWRGSLALGAIVDLTRTRLRLSARIDVLAAALLSNGTGFSIEESATSWQLGGDLGLRVAWPVSRRIAVWADLGVAGFPGSQRFSVLGVGQTPTLPKTETQAGLGLSFLLGP